MESKSKKSIQMASKKDEILIAKKDFLIVQNDIKIEIKEGQPLPEVPFRFLENLKTEGVI